MLRRLLTAVTLPFILLIGPMNTHAEESMACGNRDEMISHLSGKYAEEPVAMGLATNGSIVEVLSSKAGGSFTIVYTTPDGLTCMIAAGSNWEFVKSQIEGVKA